MARRRNENMIEVLMHLPWWFGFIAGIVAFVGINWGAGMIMSSSGGDLGRAVGSQLSGGALKPLAWTVLVVCWIGAAASALRSRSRARQLDEQASLDSIRALSWRQFEQLVGEAYRRLGYRIEETGQGGADGGIDLLLRKDGSTTLVQCKQWRTQKIGVAVVREMYGLMVHHGAGAVKIVCTGIFTSECEAFAVGKPLELVDGPGLLRLVQQVQVAPTHLPVSASYSRRQSLPLRVPVQPPSTVPATVQAPAPAVATQSAVPVCPRCAGAMAERTNRGNGQRFWGCTSFPKCRGTIAI